MRQGIADYQATGARVVVSEQLALLAGAYGKNRQPQKGLTLLAEIYDWFSEGFDTVDLQEPRQLLEALSQISENAGLISNV